MANTAHRNYPLPDEARFISEEFPIMQQQTLPMIDADIHELFAGVAARALLLHAHEIGDVTGLQGALDAKMPANATFSLSDLTDVAGVNEAPDGYVMVKVSGVWLAQAALAALGEHAHSIDQVNGLATVLGAIGSDIDTLESGVASKMSKAANGSDIANKDTFRANIGLGETGLLIKADPRAVAFTKTGVGTASIKAGTLVEVNGKLFSFAGATAITMPALTVGTDYAVWIKPDGTVEATADHVSPPVASSRKIGGFHYAPGGNAAAQAGGNATAQINEYSFWDLHFRPACPDPRGMALVAGSFWVDIYLLGVNHHTDGTSRYNVTIADGSSPPKIPAAFGGNGSSIYSTLNWWEAAEVMQSHGKQLLDVAEFGAATYGTTEATSGVTDPVSTILRAAFTSKWGVMLATGNLWVWGRDFGGSYGTAAYTANGRGSTYMLSNAALLGGYWDDGAYSGSRSSYWSYLPSNSYATVGARGRCDHLCHV